MFRSLLHRFLLLLFVFLPCGAFAAAATTAPATPRTSAEKPADDSRSEQIILDALDSVVHLKISAVAEARSAGTLGP